MCFVEIPFSSPFKPPFWGVWLWKRSAWMCVSVFADTHSEGEKRGRPHLSCLNMFSKYPCKLASHSTPIPSQAATPAEAGGGGSAQPITPVCLESRFIWGVLQLRDLGRGGEKDGADGCSDGAKLGFEWGLQRHPALERAVLFSPSKKSWMRLIY